MIPRDRQTQAIPPSPEDLFENWLDAVYPILRETWISGYTARYGGQSIPPSPADPRRNSSDSKPTNSPPSSRSPRDASLNPLTTGLIFEIPNSQLPPGWRKVYHTRGEAPCRQAAAILVRPIHAGEKVLPSEVLRTVNGHEIDGSAVSVCGFCGLELHDMNSNRDLDWTPHVIIDGRPKTVSFADEYTPTTAPYVHPIDAMDSMESSLGERLTPDEILNEVQPLTLESEEEVLRELGAQFGIYTRDIPDAAPDETQ